MVNFFGTKKKFIKIIDKLDNSQLIYYKESKESTTVKLETLFLYIN